MQAVPPPERRTRAGRNLPAAIGVGLGLGAVILVSLYVWKPAFVGVVAVAVVLGVWELTNALRADRVRVPVVPARRRRRRDRRRRRTPAAREALLVALALTVLATLLWRLPESPEGYLRDVTAGVFAALYVPFLAGFAVLLLRADDGADRVVVFIAARRCSATSAATRPACCSASTRWPRASARRSPGRASPGPALFCAVGGAVVAARLLLDGAAVAGRADRPGRDASPRPSATSASR